MNKRCQCHSLEEVEMGDHFTMHTERQEGARVEDEDGEEKRRGEKRIQVTFAVCDRKYISKVKKVLLLI